jgi:hypothetical protein
VAQVYPHDIRVHNGTVVINQAEIARRAGVDPRTVAGWYRDRASTGYPEALDPDGLWFDEDRWHHWYTTTLAPRRTRHYRSTRR